MNYSDRLSSHLIPAAVVTNIMLSLPTNGYIAWLIATGAEDSLLREFFPLNLSVFEVLYCFLSLGVLIQCIFPTLEMPYGMYKYLLWSGRPMLQCCICMEYFLAVVHPVLFLRYRTLRHKAAVAGVTWAAIVGFTFFYTFSSSIKQLVFVVECAVSVAVMLFCYVSVFAALKRPRPGKGSAQRDNNMKKRAFYTITAIIASFAVTYLLWGVTILLQMRKWITHCRKIFNQTCTFITYMSGFVQPLIYLQRRGKRSCRRNGRATG